MAEQLPQKILDPLSEASIFLVATIADSREDTVREALAHIGDLRRGVSMRDPDANLNCVTGIGSDAWDRLYNGPRPAHLHPFIELKGERHTAPSTPGDLLFHIRARRLDMCFELATQIVGSFDGAIDVVDEVQGFRYFDLRDLIGFVDGTENPEGNEAAEAVLIGDEDPTFAGCSYVVIQKYLHKMEAWNDTPVEEQERVIGRTKLDDIEMADDVKPANSHIALSNIKDEDGNDLDIYRLNMPFGNVGDGESGTYFIGYAKDPGVTERMLRNMFIGDPPGNTDRLLDFSVAVTGGLFFVPTEGLLEGGPPAATGPATQAVEAGAPSDGSLGIGSLSADEH
jgi:putative iron-dependent peroxidase